MYKRVYVYTYNSHATVLSSNSISGKQGFLHNGKAGKITDYFLFERFALCARIMKFEHLSGETQIIAVYWLLGKTTVSFPECACRSVYIPQCEFRDTAAWCCSMYDVYLWHSVRKFLLFLLCAGISTGFRTFSPSRAGPRPTRKKSQYWICDTHWGARPA